MIVIHAFKLTQFHKKSRWKKSHQLQNYNKAQKNCKRFISLRIVLKSQLIVLLFFLLFAQDYHVLNEYFELLFRV